MILEKNYLIKNFPILLTPLFSIINAFTKTGEMWVDVQKRKGKIMEQREYIL